MQILSPLCLTRHPSPYFLLNCFTKDTFLQLSAGNQLFWVTSPNRIKSLDMLILFPSFKQKCISPAEYI